MSRRANILARLRRTRSGAVRYVVGLFAVAYLAVGAVPCAAATHAMGDKALSVNQHGGEHAGHAGQHAQQAHAGHGVGASEAAHAGHGSKGAPAGDAQEHCVHCPAALEHGAAVGYESGHALCALLAELADGGAAHAHDSSLPAIAPPVAHSAFAWPPALASLLAARPSRAVHAQSVPLNVRNCVFLI